MLETPSAAVFDAQPTLVGPRLTLRPLVPADRDALYAVASDPLIWEQHPEKARATAPGFDRFFEIALQSKGALVATRTDTGEIIGTSRYFRYTAAPSEVEIGWTFLGRQYWGGTYNREMKRLMIEHAFRLVERIVFIVDPNNMRSQRAVGKIGGVRIADRIDDTGRIAMVFELTPALWATNIAENT